MGRESGCPGSWGPGLTAGRAQCRVEPGPHPSSFPTLPGSLPRITPGIACAACGASERAAISFRISRGPGDPGETTSLRSRPQPLVCLVRRSRGHIFANFVTAFIKWGFTGALSSISGLVDELNKTVWDGGAALEKVFVLRRMEPAFRALCRQGRPGSHVAGGHHHPPPHSSSWGSSWELGAVQTGSETEAGSLEDRPLVPLEEGVGVGMQPWITSSHRSTPGLI